MKFDMLMTTLLILSTIIGWSIANNASYHNLLTQIMIYTGLGGAYISIVTLIVYPLIIFKLKRK